MLLSLSRTLFFLLCLSSLTSYSADQSERDVVELVIQRVRKKLREHYPNPRARNHRVLYAIFNDCFVKSAKLLTTASKMMVPNSWEHQEGTRLGELAGQEYAAIRHEALGDTQALLAGTHLFIQKYNEHHPLARHQCDVEGRSANCRNLRNYVTYIQLPLKGCLTKSLAYQKTYPKTFAHINAIMDVTFQKVLLEHNLDMQFNRKDPHAEVG